MRACGRSSDTSSIDELLNGRAGLFLADACNLCDAVVVISRADLLRDQLLDRVVDAFVVAILPGGSEGRALHRGESVFSNLAQGISAGSVTVSMLRRVALPRVLCL